jgi:hypothetical protein
MIAPFSTVPNAQTPTSDAAEMNKGGTCRQDKERQPSFVAFLLFLPREPFSYCAAGILPIAVMSVTSM